MMTGIVVTYNTREVFERAYNSVRKHLPHMQIIIVDGSEAGNPCYEYIESLREDPFNTIFHTGYNIGHGRGMHYGLKHCKTNDALMFDSDIEMLQNPLPEMTRLMTLQTYAVGWMTQIGWNGFDYGTPGMKHIDAISYIHPYFMLLNVRQYFRFYPFVHHGAPCYKAMIDLHRKKQSWRLRNFEGLTGHTSSEGINWKGRPNKYIQHDFGGTRLNNKKLGKCEIEGIWE